MALRAGHVSASPLEGPHSPTIVAAKYLKSKAFLTSEVNIFLWVDVLGLKIIDQASRKVTSVSTYNEITSWTVDKDIFRVKIVTKKSGGGGSGSGANGSGQRIKERVFITGNGKALKLKDALEETVKLYLQEPELVKELRELATDLDVGELMPLDVADQVEPFGSGKFLDPEMGATGSAASRRHRRKSSQKVQQIPSYLGAASSSPDSNPGTPDAEVGAPKGLASKWQQPSSMKGFPCKLLTGSPSSPSSSGMSAADKGGTSVINVLLIVKRDGLHVVKANAVGERRQAIFFAYDTISSFQKTDNEFRFTVQATPPPGAHADRRPPPQAKEAMYRFVTDPAPISAAVEQYSGKAVVKGIGTPVSSPRKHMFEPVKNGEGSDNNDSDGVYDDGVELSDDEYDRDVTQRRQQDLLRILQHGMDQVEAADSEDALLERCMKIMQNLNRFISNKSFQADDDSDSDN